MVDAPSAATVLPSDLASARNASSASRESATRSANASYGASVSSPSSRSRSRISETAGARSPGESDFWTVTEKLPPLTSLNSTSTIRKPTRSAIHWIC